MQHTKSNILYVSESLLFGNSENPFENTRNTASLRCTITMKILSPPTHIDHHLVDHLRQLPS